MSLDIYTILLYPKGSGVFKGLNVKRRTYLGPPVLIDILHFNKFFFEFIFRICMYIFKAIPFKFT